ncbi:hypothetical protein [Umezawaea sp. Da 62-37]|uniref:hypothetical protein n=1 Tax=Umezawaea sp. Da 62-37 TaxID=3075927 RepID=UPI0028F6C1F1|nr:hypothetical protein [Umezawaea sp. Da 62-37]WNV90305.1 hypothetical protein RM788_19095 [Umezawaea sp. Da 62-37]
MRYGNTNRVADRADDQSHWTAGEAVAFLLSCQLVAVAAVTVTVRVYAVAGIAVAFCGITTTVWLHLRKERREARN